MLIYSFTWSSHIYLRQHRTFIRVNFLVVQKRNDVWKSSFELSFGECVMRWIRCHLMWKVYISHFRCSFLQKMLVHSTHCKTSIFQTMFLHHFSNTSFEMLNIFRRQNPFIRSLIRWALFGVMMMMMIQIGNVWQPNKQPTLPFSLRSTQKPLNFTLHGVGHIRFFSSSIH